MGHEIAGRVHSVGAGCRRVAGRRYAAVAIVVSCNHCRACLAGREHLCPNAELFGYAIDGGLAEYVLVLYEGRRAGQPDHHGHRGEADPSGAGRAAVVC